tara:strand:- start:3107 stop:4381 length:1275 start_codon:yes stop_codon:yes gene_type:complete
VNKILLYLIFIILLSNCSFGKKDIVEKKEGKELFKVIEPIKKEFNQNLNIQLKKIYSKEPFINNNSNNSGNINFETNFDKISFYKFKKIEKFKFIQSELIFTKDGEIIFFDGKGSIFKINDDLKEEWKVNNYEKKEKKLNPILYFAQDGKNLIVNDNLSKLYSIDLNNGKVLWSKYNAASFNSNIKIFNDAFFTMDFDNVIRCFSIKDGKEIWNFQTEDSFIKSQKKLSLLIKENVVFFINNLGDVTALNARNGTLVWQTPTQSNVIYENAFSLDNSDLVFFKDSIYFSNNKNELFSIDARSGIIKWKQTVNSSLKPTIIENLLFSISEEGYLFIIDHRNGNIIRITNIFKNIKNKNNEIKPTGFIVAKNKIYLSLNNGRLIKIDIRTSFQEKIHKFHGSKISRPYVFNGNMYLIRNNAIIKTN